jgi:protease IV
MRSFFKIFFASFLSLIVFVVLAFILLVATVGALTAKDKPTLEDNSVLVLNLSQEFKEQLVENPLSVFSSDEEKDIPGLYDVIRLLDKAKTDDQIKGIYLMADNNPNGFASSDEIRNAILAFRKNGKFVIAYGDMISQKSYFIANAADKVYLNPKGFFEWKGMSVSYMFIKGTLDKLEIQPQIFYAGKFKSATEMFRTEQMTAENKLQTTEWMEDIYGHFIDATAVQRKIQADSLRAFANEGKIQNADDAFKYKLVDALKYDDEVKDVLKSKLKLGKYDKINFVTINKYAKTGGIRKTKGDKIALIYAEGDIIDGKGDQGTIGGDTYRYLIRKARLDKNIKAIVFRVNSGGGSALASENIWRELSLAKQDKPVVVSFGDVAASGGYYISSAADIIFASPNTITGSIGVFGIVPNMQSFFKNKLGVTFDGVKTGPYADAGTVSRPLTDVEKKHVQAEIDRIYEQFKMRVSEGRSRDMEYVDSIAQGRVWSGSTALQLGLIDTYGGLQDAVESAARLAKLKEYRLKEFPEPENILDQIMGSSTPMNQNSKIKKEIGEENFKVFNELLRIRKMSAGTQARMPFEFSIN